jgi:PTH1 family peptidyl-tRNA hydrolase
MWLIVGLGNPGPEYQWTPHNLGFLAVDELANRGGIRVERPEGKALVGRGRLASQEVVLAKPQTMMNLSGLSVRELLGKYELAASDLVVLWDEVALPWGVIRVGSRGSDGGHNGVKSVIGALGAMDFTRVRMGVQPEHPVSDRAEYVLRPMRKGELEAAAPMIAEAGDAVEMVLAQGVEAAMNRFNRRVSPETDEAADS